MSSEPTGVTGRIKGHVPEVLAASGESQEGSVASPSGLLARPSPVRAWFALVWLSIQRQMQLQQMVGLALLLLIVSVLLTGYKSDTFTLRHRRTPRSSPMTYGEWVRELELTLSSSPLNPEANAVQQAVLSAVQAVIERSDVMYFSNVIFGIFVSFLLPIWSLSFATNALGGEREGGNIIWLLSRPISRPAIYLAKFVALLPFSLALTVGGFGLMCLAAGRPGPIAFHLYWPAVLCSTLAFSALYHLMGAYFQRPAIVAILYSFFLETILGNMPGYMKRVSISFYTRCMMFDAAQDYGVQPEKPSVYLPVDGTTAFLVLVGVTVGLLALGMILFSRKEYQDIT